MKAFFPGTFNPPTLGHLNIIEKASKLFDQVVVAIGVDTEKPPAIFTIDERLSFLQSLTQKLPNIQVITFTGLAIECAQDCDCIIRSIRTYTDFEHEKTLAYTNGKLSKIETLFLLPDEPYQSISSTVVRDIGRRGHRLGKFIPEQIESAVFEKLKGAPQ